MFAKGLAAFAAAASLAAAAAAQAPASPVHAGRPWMNAALSPDARANLALERMARAEKLRIVIGTIGLPERPLPVGWRPAAAMERPAG